MGNSLVPNGYSMQSPFVAIAELEAEIMLRIAIEFGLTPTSPRPFRNRRSKEADFA